MYGLFDITSEYGSIYSIALSGIVILTLSPIYLITGKMFDGLGKSYYSLFLNILKKIFEIVGILLLTNFISGGFSILLALVLAEVIFSVVYYGFFRYLFKKFNMDYANKDVVKIF